MAEEGELVQGPGWAHILALPSAACQAFCTVQSQFFQAEGTSAFLCVPCLFPSPTVLNPKASARAEPRSSAKPTSLSFHWVLLGR